MALPTLTPTPISIPNCVKQSASHLAHFGADSSADLDVHLNAAGAAPGEPASIEDCIATVTPCRVSRAAVDRPVSGCVPPVDPGSTDVGSPLRQAMVGEDGSVATEYGLLAVVAATIVAVVLEWATSGGITGLLESVLARVAQLVGL